MLMEFAALLRAKRLRHSFNLKSVKLSRQHDRWQAQIKNIQTIFQKKHTQLESQSKMQQAQVEQQMRAQMSGLYGGSYGSFGSYGAGLLGNMAGSIFSQLVQKGVADYNSSDNTNRVEGAETVDAENIWGIINGTVTGASQAVKQVASAIQQQAQFAIQQQRDMMEQNITNMKLMIEQEKNMRDAMLDEQEEEMLLPLNEKDTENECERTYVQTRLEELKEEIQTLQEECKEEAKNSAPKFGL